MKIIIKNVIGLFSGYVNRKTRQRQKIKKTPNVGILDKVNVDPDTDLQKKRTPDLYKEWTPYHNSLN